jgi:hypothetical protein
MHPEFVDFSQERNQWVGDYEASIEIEDTELRGLIDHALQRIHADWPTILESRAAMPPAELQRTIQDANRYVREFSKRQ